MKLFEIKDYNLYVTEEAYGLLPFKAILKRDKSRFKETAFKEMLFIYYYSDVRSDYMYLVSEKERCFEIIKDIGLPVEWKIDSIIKEAIDFYESRSLSVIGKLYKSALKSANDTSDYLLKTDELLNERTSNGSTVTTLPMITAAQKLLPSIMSNLKAAYKEVLAEQKELEGRTKGSRTMGLFEDGLNID
jgi:hypothetical protein